MIKIMITICLLLANMICSATNVSVSTDVSGGVNVNGIMSSVGGDFSVAVGSSSGEQDIIYTLEVTARPIKRNKPYVKSIDQIHYTLAGLTTATGTKMNETLPWTKTITTSGVVTANLTVAYANSFNSVTNRRQFNRVKNSEINIRIIQNDEVLEEKNFRPTISHPTESIELDFSGTNAAGIAIGGSISIGHVTIEDNEVVTTAKEIVVDEQDDEYPNEYTFEVNARPIRKGKSFLKEVERLRYWLTFHGGTNMDTLMNVRLPWSKTISKDRAIGAEIHTEYINSLDPFFNKKHAKYAKNTILILNVYHGGKLIATKEYQPNQDETIGELEVEFNNE